MTCFSVLAFYRTCDISLFFLIISYLIASVLIVELFMNSFAKVCLCNACKSCGFD